MDKKINSKEYWDERFETGDWAEKGGNRQTRFFYTLLLEHLPDEIKAELNNEAFTICDVGCAEGDGTKILNESFDKAQVVGMDISVGAVKKARERYKDISFISKLDTQYDVIVSSNTLEHFEDPVSHLKELFFQAKKYVILLVPFEEYDRVAEHFFTFEYDFFKFAYQALKLRFFQEFYCDEPTIWQGKQLLLVFQKDCNYEEITIASMGIGKMLKEREEKISQFEQLLQTKETELSFSSEKINALELEIETIANDQMLIEKKNNQLNHQLNTIYSSNIWKLAQKYYALKEIRALQPLVKIGRSVKRYGSQLTLKKIGRKGIEQIKKLEYDKANRKQLEEILEKYPNGTIVILPMLVDWDIPLFQRPQHLAKNLAKEGYLYFYCTGNAQYESVNGFENKSERCYVTNRFDLVDAIENRRKVYDLSSTDNRTDWHFVQERLGRGDGILYQYIDEISDDLSGFQIPKKTWEKHTNILKDERCIVIPSATKLENDVKKYRNKNYKLVTNGVEVEHFAKKIAYKEYPEEIQKIVDKKKPIVGYFGAFASWFSYDLVATLAQKESDLEIVLLGWDYDGSIKKAGLERYENITVLGPIPYQKLPKYAACFDVSTIPFVINDITESTSPIKLFEYMAMGKPIVTTDMPECRKYESVLIGKDHEDFIAKIEKALTLHQNAQYLATLEKEAHENSWEAKAKDIAQMIEQQKT